MSSVAAWHWCDWLHYLYPYGSTAGITDCDWIIMTLINNQNLYLQREHNRCQTAMTEKVTVGLSAVTTLSKELNTSEPPSHSFASNSLFAQPTTDDSSRQLWIQHVVDIILQLITFYFMQTSSANIALQHYVLKSINGPTLLPRRLMGTDHLCGNTRFLSNLIDCQPAGESLRTNPKSPIHLSCHSIRWGVKKQPQTVFLTQVSKDTPELVHYLVTLTALEQVNITVEAQHSTRQATILMQQAFSVR